MVWSKARFPPVQYPSDRFFLERSEGFSWEWTTAAGSPVSHTLRVYDYPEQGVMFDFFQVVELDEDDIGDDDDEPLGIVAPWLFT